MGITQRVSYCSLNQESAIEVKARVTFRTQQRFSHGSNQELAVEVTARVTFHTQQRFSHGSDTSYVHCSSLFKALLQLCSCLSHNSPVR